MRVRRNHGTGRNVKCQPCRPISCPLFFAALQGAGDVALLCAAAEQCDDLMGVTNDLSGQRAGDFFCPPPSDRGGDGALNVCTFQRFVLP